MLPLRFIRENADLVRAGLSARGDDAPLDELLELDRKRRALLVDVEGWRAERKRVSRAIGAASDASEREALIAQTRGLSKDL
ncbi:MAG: serine--tRNA ligase, partial [Chloroflexi bacterium]|nr:serine--tRNA ligase [Chloroflexota bacterium]